MEVIKDYDCIAEARKAKARISAEIKGKSAIEVVRYFERGSREFKKAQREYRRQQQQALK
ncbi:hypothetical protein [Chitinophaga tropicalis]|uniref:Uncharacterized protein n=1 Tax=Chitinophaga tropicalis TaxID=2683588 RepID=A0A7K1U477_9BACT|nr:hypothetical protein [Chitinophaga tropicalis]MVT09164.1 hypothetical protein [Chitinophaga tropicalis]